MEAYSMAFQLVASTFLDGREGGSSAVERARKVASLDMRAPQG
jgi:hypothetical protein